MAVDLSRWSARQIMAAALGLCALLTGGAYYVGVAPVLAEREQADSVEAALAERTRQLDQLQQRRARQARQLAGVRERAGECRLQLKPADALNRRLARLGRMAGEMGLQIESLQPGLPQDRGWYRKIAIDVVARGRYPDCARFLHELGKAFPDVGVTSLDLTGDPAKPDQPANLTMHLAWYAAPAAGGQGSVQP